MKKEILIRIATLFLALIPGLVLADAKDVALITEKPQQKYIVISPLSAEGKQMEKIFRKIQKRAKSLKADAVIEWNCTQRVSGVTFHNCSGLAVKWVN